MHSLFALAFLVLFVWFSDGCDFSADSVTAHVAPPSDWFKELDGGEDGGHDE